MWFCTIEYAVYDAVKEGGVIQNLQCIGEGGIVQNITMQQRKVACRLHREKVAATAALLLLLPTSLMLIADSLLPIILPQILSLICTF